MSLAFRLTFCAFTAQFLGGSTLKHNILRVGYIVCYFIQIYVWPSNLWTVTNFVMKLLWLQQVPFMYSVTRITTAKKIYDHAVM